MRPTSIATLACAVLFILAPASALVVEGQTVYQKNVSYLESFVGLPLDTPMIMMDGASTTLGDMIHESATRVGAVDLARAVQGLATADAPDGTGDIWILDVGDGACWYEVEADQPVTAQNHPQKAPSVYGGYLGSMGSSHGDRSILINWYPLVWSVQETDTAGFEATGSINPFCASTHDGTKHYALPFIDGVAEIKD